MSEKLVESNRTKVILEMCSIEKLTLVEDGLELNEGYSYKVDGSIPQVADGIAKLAIEFDKSEDMGKNAGEAFLSLISNYYYQLRKED